MITNIEYMKMVIYVTVSSNCLGKIEGVHFHRFITLAIFKTEK